ncbi:nitroreductase [Candidatus Bathyarchaeota archaeon]|nr:nitroreductase [Candidatus Bathyarchaeota archaeon]
MDTFEAIQARKSIRSYQDKPVPRAVLERILEAGRLAPSAANTKPWHFIAVVNQEKRKILSKGVYAKFAAEAPLVIVVLGNKKTSPDWYTVDASLAAENMVLAAVNEGLGTCFVGSFNESEVKAALKVPENFKVLVMITVGYPKEKLDLTSKLLRLVQSRKQISEVASEEEFTKPFVPQKNAEH